MRTQRKAFTLIELLVVIAIIAILAAILFPVFAQAKSAAKKAACVSNLKNIALAWIMYPTDYDDQLPRPPMSIGGITVQWWGGQNGDLTLGPLYPYMKNTQIIDCPDAKDIPKNPLAPFAYVPNPMISNSFSLTRENGNGKSPGAPLNLSTVELSPETFLMFDVANWNGGMGATLGCNPTAAGFTASQNINGLGTPAVTLCIQGRHNGQANFSWMDGHVKSMNVDYYPNDLVGNFFATFPQSVNKPAAQLKRNKLGDKLKFPRTCFPVAGTDTPCTSWKDDWYWYPIKPTT